jgi:hypothetical protein
MQPELPVPIEPNELIDQSVQHVQPEPPVQPDPQQPHEQPDPLVPIEPIEQLVQHVEPEPPI